MYGPTSTNTRSPLGFDATGAPVLFWDSGVPRGAVTIRAPKMLFDLETPEGATAGVILPAGPGRILVNNPDKEIVAEHFGVMTGPQIGPTLGVYLVTETRADGLVVCEAVISNGTCDPRVNFSWPGCLRFSKIRLRIVTPGWVATPIDFGPRGDWYFGIRTAFCARWVMFRASDGFGAQAKALALARLDDLKIDPNAVRGAGRHKIGRLREGRASPLPGGAPKLGPLYFDSLIQNGYEAGGTGIEPTGGWEGSESAARSYAADVTRTLSRHGVALSDSRTGEPIWPDAWPRLGPYKLYDARYETDPWNWAGMQGTVVGMFGWDRTQGSRPREVNPGPSSSRAAVLAYKPHDREHLGRVTSRTLPAWQQCRSWAARWLLRMNAADVLTAYSGLPAMVAAARANPGHGSDYLRGSGWAMESIAAALCLTPPGPERDCYLAFRALMLEYQSLTCLPNGFARDGTKASSSDNGVPWQQGLPNDYGACAVFQFGIWANGYFDLWANGPEVPAVPNTRVVWLLSQALEQLIGIAKPDGHGQISPPSYVGVSRNGVAENPITVGTTDLSYTGHFNHDHHALCLATIASGDPKWRKMIPRLGVQFSSAQSQLATWRQSPTAWNALPLALGGAE